MAMPRPVRLKFRSLHYKEMLIFLNMWKELFKHPMWGDREVGFREVLVWMDNFQAYLACKVIEDTFGYVTLKSLRKTLDFATDQTARRRIQALIKMGLLSYTGQVGNAKHYHIRGLDAFTNWYPQNWHAEYQRLISLGIKMPSIKYADKKRPKRPPMTSQPYDASTE